MRRPGFRSLRRVAGSAIGKIAIATWVCPGCGLQTPGKDRPGQCPKCGRMDQFRIDSKAEARRFAQLAILQMAGDIKNLRRQVSFNLYTINRLTKLEIVVARYVADFVYEEDDGLVVEDVKGAITDVAHLKLRWMEAQGLPVQIIT